MNTPGIVNAGLYMPEYLALDSSVTPDAPGATTVLQMGIDSPSQMIVEGPHDMAPTYFTPYTANDYFATQPISANLSPRVSSVSAPPPATSAAKAAPTITGLSDMGYLTIGALVAVLLIFKRG